MSKMISQEALEEIKNMSEAQFKTIKAKQIDRFKVYLFLCEIHKKKDVFTNDEVKLLHEIICNNRILQECLEIELKE